MGLFKTNYDFNYIEKKTNESKKKFQSIEQQKSSNTKNLNITIYQKSLKYLYNAFLSINSENSKLKNYISELEKTNGDYRKRDNNMFSAVSLMQSFINDEIKTDNEIRSSLLGIFLDSYEILTSSKYTNMFKIVFKTIDKKGETNTLLTTFKLAYISLCYMVETSTVYLVEYELDVYNGKSKRNAILDLMNRYNSFMKNVAIPMIDLIAFLQSISNPVAFIQKINTEENKALTKEHAYLIQNDINSDRSEESSIALVGYSMSVPTLVAVAILTVLALIFLFPLLRQIIYYMKIRNIDIGKQLELKAEIFDNNIILLKQKLEKTEDLEEQKRLIKIIDKQKVYVEKWRSNARKLLGEEISINYKIEETINTEDSQKDETPDNDIIL